MTRGLLPNPSARAGWLLVGIIDRALHRWGHVSPLDGGPGDHDHNQMMTTSPVVRSSICSHQVSYPLNFSPIWGGSCLADDFFFG